MKLLRDYEIPVKLIQKATYDADVETASVTPLPTEEKNVEEPEQEPQEPVVAETPKTEEEEQLIVWPLEPEETETVKPIKRHGPSNTHFMTGLGWNILPVNGPELLLGIDVSHHVIELSGVYGLKKTDPLYYYSTNRKDENPYAGWQYTAISGSLSYGYDVFPEAPASMVPMIGVKGNIFNGKTADGMKGTKDDFKKASSVSAFVALRLTLSLGKHFKLQVTPRYDLSVSKSNNCKLICDYDDTLKGWTRGFNLSAGLIIK